MLIKSAKLLKKDEETKGKFKYGKIDGTMLRNTTSGELVAKELGVPGAPAIYWFKVSCRQYSAHGCCTRCAGVCRTQSAVLRTIQVKQKIEQVLLRNFGTGSETADNMFDFMKVGCVSTVSLCISCNRNPRKPSMHSRMCTGSFICRRKSPEKTSLGG